MLIWVCALHCEAKPVIDHFRLRKARAGAAFDCYLGENQACVISGIGKLASAGATAWIAARLAPEAPLAWINLGTAGAAAHPLGTALLLNQVIDADSGRRYYPVPLQRSRLAAAACTSLAQPSEDYRDDRLYDMEASGFLASALRFSSAELARCIKIVSDNRHEKTGRDRAAISRLVQRNLEAICEQAEQLTRLRDELAQREIDPESWRCITALAHFSDTRQSRLRGLLRYLLSRDHSLESLLEQLAGQSSSAAIIASLERLSYRDSESLQA